MGNCLGARVVKKSEENTHTNLNCHNYSPVQAGTSSNRHLNNKKIVNNHNENSFLEHKVQSDCKKRKNKIKKTKKQQSLIELHENKKMSIVLQPSVKQTASV